MKLSEIAKLISAELIGSPKKEIYGVASISAPRPDKITFIEKKNMNNSDFSSAAALLISPELKNHYPHKNLLIVENPKFAFAKLCNLFVSRSSKPVYNKNFKALVGQNVLVGENYEFGSNVVIEDGVSIGKNARISDNVVIHKNVTIGDNIYIGSGSVIGSEGFGNVLTDENNWFHINHLGSVAIGNNVRIGSNCCIDRGTLHSTHINDGVIIDNLVHIAHNVIVGENTAIAAKVGIAGSCVIGKRNMIGGMVGIVDHINTADDVIISATSTVNKDLKEPGTYTGIMPISKHSAWKRIALWITKLDKISKFINFKISKL